MFAAAGVEYEDCRLTMEEFKKLKEGNVQSQYDEWYKYILS
jgi:hypothetical protein